MLAVSIHIDEPITSLVDTALIEQTIAVVLEQEQQSLEVEVGVLITDNATMHHLNHTYRGIDAPTDVLSFADDSTEESHFVLPDDSEEPVYLGDVALSYERVCMQAAEYGHSVRRELAYLVAHAMLHLLGYDHERGDEDTRLMRTREELAMQTLQLPA